MVREYILHMEPLSYNSVYQTGFRTGRKFLSKEGKAYKAFIKEALEVQDRNHGGPLDFEFCEITFLFLLPKVRGRGEGQAFFFKNGKPRRLDVSNFIKLLEDAIAEHNGLDDSRHISIHGYKRIHPEDRAEVRVYLSDANVDDPVYHRGLDCVSLKD